ncbi:uncharacterized protein LOC115217674 [Octopus sinensis]|uniref:Uncharacterized protein LOC115217674 n=1 Tax=Octopus sinensis TaxID=2607531 RepID=A0A6P7SYQ1_9MOLL|nr:uncharacterized protein LOC115217674 [Octopus sinensis]
MEKIVNESKKHWNTEMIGRKQKLGKVNIRHGIFQGDSLSPLLFVLVMTPLTLILRKVKIAYDLGKGSGQINHLLFMDDVKIYAKNEKQLESLYDSVVETRRPDIAVVDKMMKETKIIDIVIPRADDKELEKIEKYKPLKDEAARMWAVKKVTVI